MKRLRRRLVAEAGLLADPWAVAAVYVLVVGGLMAGIFVPELRLLTAAIGAVVVADWLRHLHERHDLVDAAAIGAVVLLAVGVPFSQQTRFSAELLAYGLALAAAFIRLRRHFAVPVRRDRMLAVAGRVAAAVAVIVAAVWVWESLRWTAAGGPGALPPLGLDHPDDWLRNVNVVPIYLVLLAAGLAHCWMVRGERLLAGAGTVGLFVVTVLSGSRAAWLGVVPALAFIAAAALLRRGRWQLRSRPGLLLGLGALLAVGLVAVGLLTGAGAALVAEATDLATLETRAAMWNAAIGTWASHPLAGAGLGTMPGQLLVHGLAAPGSGVLPAPHAHSVPLQLAAEAGLLGLAGVGVAVVAVAVGAVRGRGAVPATSWLVPAVSAAALVAFAVNGLADNHLALGAVGATVLANAALLVPKAPTTGVPSQTWRRGRRATLPALGLLAALIAAQGLGAVAWGRSQAAVQAGDAGGAVGWLEIARRLDPAFPLYARELGKLTAWADRAGARRESRGEALLIGAARNLPADPNTWRALGVLALVDDRPGDALGHLTASRELDASQARTHLLSGMALDALGRAGEGDNAYVTALLTRPALASSDGWRAIGVAPERLHRVVRVAVDRAAAAGPESELATAHPELLAALGDRRGLRLLAQDGAELAPMWLAVVEAEAGNADVARGLIDELSPLGRRFAQYWLNRATVFTLLGDRREVERSYRLGALVREDLAPPTDDPSHAAAIGRDPNDFWMYARSTAWFSDVDTLRLPSPERGAFLRLTDPARIELPRDATGG